MAHVVVGEPKDRNRLVIRDPKLRERLNPPLSREARERCERLERMTMTPARMRATVLD